MQLTGYKSFENAQICIGGVSLEDVNGLTLESKLAHGIYFAERYLMLMGYAEDIIFNGRGVQDILQE